MIPLLGAAIESAASTKSVGGENSVIDPPVLVAVPLTITYLPTCAEVSVKVELVAPAISTQVVVSLADVQATH